MFHIMTVGLASTATASYPTLSLLTPPDVLTFEAQRPGASQCRWNRRAKSARARGTVVGDTNAGDELGILTGPVHAVGSGHNRVGEHAAGRRNAKVVVPEAANVADPAQQVSALRGADQRSHRSLFDSQAFDVPRGRGPERPSKGCRWRRGSRP